ncbi:MAG: hypothetical protein M3270_04060 [Thermoproteota archaeon]|nr:hypothetical protein [Thermoproteota archaeon]
MVKYAEIDIMRLLLMAVPTTLFMLTLIPTADSAAGITATPIPVTLSNNVLNIPTANPTIADTPLECCTPLLLVPIASSGNNVYVAWSGNDTGHLEIIFRASSDNGQTFSDKINLSNSPGVNSVDPQISASDNHVYITWWEDYGNGTRAPFFKTSDDYGITFEAALSLSNNTQIASQDTISNE